LLSSVLGLLRESLFLVLTSTVLKNMMVLQKTGGEWNQELKRDFTHIEAMEATCCQDHHKTSKCAQSLSIPTEPTNNQQWPLSWDRESFTRSQGKW
jgi:hypothetical protein